MAEQRETGIPLECVSEGNAYDAEREKVRRLRLAGLECREIAEQTGIPVGQALVYCLQLGLPTSGICGLGFSEEEEEWLRYRKREPAGMRYPVCGSVLEQPQRGRWKKFCSNACHDKWWNREKRRDESGGEITCENCGKKFPVAKAARRKRRFCCRKCYFEYRYGRRVSEDE